MSDLIDDPTPGQNMPEFTVSDLSGAVKKVIEGEFGLVRVRGEIGRVNAYASGHIYYDLKDDGAVISAVTWRGQAAGLSVRPEEGLEVVATGKLTTFAKQSRYQLNVHDLRVAGVGALMAMLEKRKQALAKEGLFDQDRKQRIPFLPRRIGVVTSPKGAVIRDIIHRLRDRFPREVLVWPVAVQGDASAPQVARAVDGFNAMEDPPDVIIVARGGGSVEDLWGFNEEIVVRAVAASAIPVISAVGHETDTTLIDYVSDLRAPTPTAAAELAVPVRADLISTLASYEERAKRAMATSLAMRKQRLADLARAVPDAKEIVQRLGQKLDTTTHQLEAALRRNFSDRARRFEKVAAGLRPSLLSQALILRKEKFARLLVQFHGAIPKRATDARTRFDALSRLSLTLGYEATLDRGFAVVHGADGVISSKEAAQNHAQLSVEFADGSITVQNGSDAPAMRKPKPAKPSGSSDDPQGSLF